MLYGSGYRIDELKTAQEEDAQRDEAEKGVESKNLLEKEKGSVSPVLASVLPGEQEWERQKSVVHSKAPDQVRF